MISTLVPDMFIEYNGLEKETDCNLKYFIVSMMSVSCDISKTSPDIFEPLFAGGMP